MIQLKSERVFGEEAGHRVVCVGWGFHRRCKWVGIREVEHRINAGDEAGSNTDTEVCLRALGFD